MRPEAHQVERQSVRDGDACSANARNGVWMRFAETVRAIDDAVEIEDVANDGSENEREQERPESQPD